MEAQVTLKQNLSTFVRNTDTYTSTPVHPLREKKFHVLINSLSIGRTTVELIKHLQLNVSHNATFDMVVRRSNVVTDALRRMERATFNPQNKLHVSISVG